MAETFKPGDFVQLKSGSPLMTVDHVYMKQVTCQWFSGSKLNQGTFDADTLVRGKKPGEKESKE